MILGVIKPKGISSFAVVVKIRRLSGVKKVGHAGTLDPMAQGVLIVAVGRQSTRQIASLMTGEKVYKAQITLGARSTTDDALGILSQKTDYRQPNIGQVESALQSFVGTISQVPPAYSAIKIAGKRAYDLARKGEAVPMQAREVTVKQVELLDYAWPTVEVRITCGKGVYIRSIARDLGEMLGTGGYLTFLDRTRVGDYDYENSIRLEDLNESLFRLADNSRVM